MTTPSQLHDTRSAHILFALRALISMRDDAARLDHYLAFVDDAGSTITDADAMLEQLANVRDCASGVHVDACHLLTVLGPDDAHVDMVRAIAALARIQHALHSCGKARVGELLAYLLREELMRRAIDPASVLELADGLATVAGTTEARSHDVAQQQARDLVDAMLDPIMSVATDQRFGPGDLRMRLEALLHNPATIAMLAAALGGRRVGR